MKRFFVTSLVICSAIGGCAGYAGDVKTIRTKLGEGNQSAALTQANAALDVAESDHYPTKIDGDTTLLLMERATIKQSLGNYHPSSLDFRLADKHLEMLDVKRDPMGKLGEWMFSGSAGIYRAMPYEKMLLSTLNMVNYLAKTDLESARVEARRLTLTQRLLADDDHSTRGNLGLANYLAGFTYEMSHRYEQALQQYALAQRTHDYPSLVTVVPRVARCTSYRGDVVQKAFPFLFEQDPPFSSAENASCQLPHNERATLLIVSSVGLVPYRISQRIPIGAAIVIAGAWLTPAQSAQANEFAIKGLLKWVNYPELIQDPYHYDRALVRVNGQSVPSEYGVNVSQLVHDAFEETKGKLMAAAIVRMITRAAAGGATSAAVGNSSGNSGLGLLAQVLVEGAMTAADTPDTRSWNTLPGSVFLTRVDVPAGHHTVDITFKGIEGTLTRTTTVDVSPGGFAVIPVHTLR